MKKIQAAIFIGIISLSCCLVLLACDKNGGDRFTLDTPSVSVAASIYIDGFENFVGLAPGEGETEEETCEHEDEEVCNCEFEIDELGRMILFAETEFGKIVEVEYFDFNNMQIDLGFVSAYVSLMRYTFIEFASAPVGWKYENRHNQIFYMDQLGERNSYVIDHETGYMFEIKLNDAFTIVGDDYIGQDYLYPVVEHDDKVYITVGTLQSFRGLFGKNNRELYEIRAVGKTLVQKKIIDVLYWGLDWWNEDNNSMEGNSFHFVDKHGSLYYTMIKEEENKYAVHTIVRLNSGLHIVLDKYKASGHEVEQIVSGGFHTSRYPSVRRSSNFLTLAYNGLAYTKDGTKYVNNEGILVASTGNNPFTGFYPDTPYVESIYNKSLTFEYMCSEGNTDYFIYKKNELYNGSFSVYAVIWEDEISYKVELVKDFGTINAYRIDLFQHGKYIYYSDYGDNDPGTWNRQLDYEIIVQAFDVTDSSITAVTKVHIQHNSELKHSRTGSILFCIRENDWNDNPNFVPENKFYEFFNLELIPITEQQYITGITGSKYLNIQKLKH